MPFGGEIARVGRPTANLVIVFETFKRSHNLKAWLRFAPRRGKIILASYCMYLFSRCSVERRDSNTECHRILSYLLWYSTMVSMGRSVHSYICADLLSTREGSPSKGGGCICTPLPPPPWIRHCIGLGLVRHVQSAKRCRGSGGLLPQENVEIWTIIMRVLLRPSETTITTQTLWRLECDLHGRFSEPLSFGVRLCI